jgi:transposase
LDESGFSEQPSVRRTWARKGQTPVLSAPVNWQQLSAIGALALSPDRSRVRTFLSLHAGPLRAPQVIAFLRSLCRHLRGKALLVWDRLSAHRARLTRDWRARQRHWLTVEWLPGYAPELNPVENLWAYLKAGDAANFCALDLADLALHISRRVRRVRTQHHLPWSFLKHSGLYPSITSLRDNH